jgi:hypothetical protein
MERLLGQGRLNDGRTVSFYKVDWPSPMCLIAQERVAAEPENWPASIDPLHWGDLMKPLAGSPADVGQGLWLPEYAPATPRPVGLVTEAALFVATFEDPSVGGNLPVQRPVAYAAILPHDVHRQFDLNAPMELVDETPWRSLGVLDDFAETDLGNQIGTVALQWAKCKGCQNVHLFMSATWPLPTEWRGYPCQVIHVGPYCHRIPKRDGTRKGDQMFIRINLNPVPSAPEPYGFTD